ncbi:DUF3800 domain-containing protein [Jiella sp. MQZ9-1]|uniref:DUF3800 domain-containing protein n=1 Tax=Jiella flava TaxID=2816857 RepID=A0A939FXU9_9HYPH|nr:DUF3800 domain-containing protein [Jiella flava]MCD2472052.1 DUF3800 domain-containing protein [Jiella flava]
MASPAFSDFVFYADESGDHSLASLDAAYPIFCLTLCVFEKKAYARSVVPAFQALKFRYFGHDTVVLHERELRKQINDFHILTDRGLRESFTTDLTAVMKDARFRIIACVIEKRRISADLFPEHPYHISLKICLECAYHFLRNKGQVDRITHFIFERRGPKEDKELELEFLRIAAGQNDLGRRLDNFRLVLADKKINSTGMQVADLVARPIGLHILRPAQPNRAFSAVSAKYFGVRVAAYAKRGIHVLKSERPRITPRPDADREPPIHL